MNRTLLFILILLPIFGSAQSYSDTIYQFRQDYKMSLLKGDHPLKPEDTARFSFYEPDPAYRVKATFDPITSNRPFRLITKNGGVAPVATAYGTVYFKMNGSAITLYVFRIMTKSTIRMFARSTDNADNDFILFIPFYDNTNYKETYRGGRYIDVSAADLANGKFTLDFNKACNLYGAYEKGYPYIVTPLLRQDYSPLDAANYWAHPTEEHQNETTMIPANTVLVNIKAGEKEFRRK